MGQQFPTIQACDFKGNEIEFPQGEEAVLILSFDKLQYPTAMEWFQDIEKNYDGSLLNMPMLSDRFLLMKDVLFEGIKKFFKGIEDHTRPAFINRIRFFDNTGLDENSPVIAVLDKDNNFHIYDSPAAMKKALAS